MMKTKIHFIIYIAIAVSLISCESVEEQGVVPAVDYLKIVETVKQFPKDAGEHVLSVESNCDWDYDMAIDNSWLDLEHQKTSSGIMFKTGPNTTRSVRQGTVTVKTVSSIIRKTINLIQAQGDIILELSGGDESKTLNFSSLGGNGMFTITSNTSWEIHGKPDWIQLNQSSGTGTAVIEVTIGANLTEEVKDATLIVEAENNSAATTDIRVHQNKAARPVVTELRLDDSSISLHEATLSFKVNSEFPVLSCGLCYVESDNSNAPTSIDNPHPASDPSADAQAVMLTNLKAGVTYRVRAYATSAIGVGYSETVELTTLGSKPSIEDNTMPNPR